MRRRHLSLVFPLLALLAIAWLFWDEIDASGVLHLFDGAAKSRPGESSDESRDAELRSQLELRARLRGLPGVRTALTGSGRLTGAVRQYVPNAAARPLPQVRVRVVGAGDGEGWHEEVATTEDGTFAFGATPAHVGYAVIVDHPPYREVVLQGVCVDRDRTTDVGTILLGGPASLRGEVVDGTGRPVPGSRVRVFPDRSRPRRFDWRRGLFELQSALEFLAEARTGRDGAFVLRDLPPGRYVLRTSSPGYATVFREDVWVTADERTPSVRVVLDPGAGYHGRVIDEVGGGIGGARVLAVSMASGKAGRLDRVETRSDAQGRYRLDVLVAGNRYFVEAWAEGFAPAGRIGVPAGVEALDLVLRPSGRVEGTITDAATGEGIEGAEVTIVAGTVNTLSPVSSVTDADGRYALPHVSAGPIVLFAAKADGFPAGSFDLGSAGGRAVQAGQTLVIDWGLEPGRSAFGRVTDDSGQPIGFATVAFAHRRRRSEGEETGLTSADGSYQVTGLRPGEYDVRVTAPGYAPLTTDEETRLEMPEDGRGVRHDVVLARGARLNGTVLTPDGAPASGARIEVTATGGRSLRDRVRDLVAVTAATGQWRITGVPPGVDVIVEADHDEWVKAATSPIRLAPGEERDFDLTLRSGVRLTGRVTDPRGAALARARVRWGPIGPDDERALRDAFRADQLLTPRVVRTAGDGGFVLDHLPPGRLLLKVEREGYSDWYRKDVVLSADGTHPDITVEMNPSGTIAGTVRDAQSRRGISDAWVYAREEDPDDDDAKPPDDGRVRALVSGQTDRDGRYRLEGVPPDRALEVVVWLALGYVAETQDRRDPSVRRKGVRPDATNVDFDLMPQGAEEDEER